MIIQHNMEAAMANRCLDINQKNLKVSSQRLACGYRISSAADDAAGLKISEKMRAQIRGLNRASDNLGEGIALVQTADGALQEVHAILQRMAELSVQAGNDTNDAGDRFAIQQEINELRSEINRISTDTEYNKIKIFKPTNIPQMEGRPSDLMIFHETGPDGNPRPGGIFYNGVRYPYSQMGLQFDSNENIVAGTYQVYFLSEDGNPAMIELIFDGGNRIPSGRQYTLIPDEKGISIDNILHSWESIGIDPNNIQGGNYSFKHAGITFSFDIENGLNLDSLIEELYKDGLTTYQLRSSAWTEEEAKINPDISIYPNTNPGLQISAILADNHLIPGNTSSNNSYYKMYADHEKICLYIPAEQSTNGQPVPLTVVDWDYFELTEWMSGNSGCINPGYNNSWQPGSHITNGEQYRVYQYLDLNTAINIQFTIDSEVSKDELIEAINNWSINVETTTKMFFDCTAADDKYKIKFGPHSASLDAYGTQHAMGLCTEDRGENGLTLTTTDPIVTGSNISFTMTDKKSNTHTFSASLDSIQTNINGQLYSLISSYTSRIQYNLNNPESAVNMPSATKNERIRLYADTGNYWADISYEQDLSNFLDPDDTNMFLRVQDTETGKWTVTFNENQMPGLQMLADNLANDIKNSLGQMNVNVTTNGRDIYAENTISSDTVTKNIRYSTQVVSGTREIKIQSSDNAWDHIKIELPGMNASIIGISNLDVSSYAAASASIEKIHSAINMISGMRSHFGALQNRMESAMAVDDIMAENTQAAESRIRDADMAKESLEFTKHSILNQAAQAVLAQSNHTKEGISALLQ